MCVWKCRQSYWYRIVSFSRICWEEYGNRKEEEEEDRSKHSPSCIPFSVQLPSTSNYLEFSQHTHTQTTYRSTTNRNTLSLFEYGRTDGRRKKEKDREKKSLVFPRDTIVDWHRCDTMWCDTVRGEDRRTVSTRSLLCSLSISFSFFVCTRRERQHQHKPNSDFLSKKKQQHCNMWQSSFLVIL